MKRFLITACCIMTFIGTLPAQTTALNYTEANDAFANVLVDFPDMREIRSGSKILVTYEGDWPEDMKGAFEYAAKLWEENLPTAIPIRIRASIMPFPSSHNAVSMVNMYSFDVWYENEPDSKLIYPLSALKSTVLKEYNRYAHQYTFSGRDNIAGFMDHYDMEIAYNSKKIDEMYFGLDAEVGDRYDFVTLALRDILTGLGLCNRFTATNASRKLNMDFMPYTPFETLIFNALKTSDPEEAYTAATCGSLPVTSRFDYMGNLYAPSPFVNGLSLRYFIPDESLPFTRLMTYDFSKGYVMRDISFDWDSFFEKNLKWDWALPVGSISSNVSESGDSGETIAYDGTVDMTFDSPLPTPSGESEGITGEEGDKNKAEAIDISCQPYWLGKTLNARGIISIPVYILSVQRNDGSWEPLWDHVAMIESPISIRPSDYPLSQPESSYARSLSGNLKYRLVRMIAENFYSGYGYDFAVKYFTREFKPQTPVIKYKEEYYDKVTRPESKGTDADDYFAEVEIGISNLEGTERLTVEQTTGDDRVPTVFEVKDFRKGNFTATVLKGYPTKFQAIAYNKNGVAKSAEIIVPAIKSSPSKIKFEIQGDCVAVKGLDGEDVENGIYTFMISSPTDVDCLAGPLDHDMLINTSGMQKGIYIVSVYKRDILLGTTKFVK